MKLVGTNVIKIIKVTYAYDSIYDDHLAHMYEMEQDGWKYFKQENNKITYIRRED